MKIIRIIRLWLIRASEVAWLLLAFVTWLLLTLAAWKSNGWLGVGVALPIGGLTVLTTLGIVLAVYDINDHLRILTGKRRAEAPLRK